MSEPTSPESAASTPAPFLAATMEAASLTKANLAEALFNKIGINRSEALEMIDAFFDMMRDALVLGEEVKLSGFGSFRVRNKRERPGRNLRTKEIVTITPRRVVTFHASNILRERLDKGSA